MYSKNVKPSMSLGESLTSVFHNYATFTGRARRSEYWWFTICYYVIVFIFNIANFGFMLQVLSGEMSTTDPSFTMLMMASVVLGLGLFLPALAVTVRRFHDIGKSGWNMLWAIIPVIGLIIVLVWMCQDSDVVANKYGESPKYGYFSERKTNTMDNSVSDDEETIIEKPLKQEYKVNIADEKENSSFGKYVVVAFLIVALIAGYIYYSNGSSQTNKPQVEKASYQDYFDK